MSIPNILSVFRLALAPVFVLVYYSGAEHARAYAAGVYVIASATDVIDGYIARKFDKTTELGKILDPLGDKIMTFTVLICVTIDKLIPIWVVIVFGVKELMMGIGGLVLHRKLSSLPHSNYLGKTATVAFFIACTVLMVFPNINPVINMVLICVAIAIMILAFFSYIAMFMQIIKKEREHGKNKGEY